MNDIFIHGIFLSNDRPDLVDFSKLNKASPDQNLEYSFHVAEKELGVPRLLDVEGEINKFTFYLLQCTTKVNICHAWQYQMQP